MASKHTEYKKNWHNLTWFDDNSAWYCILSKFASFIFPDDNICDNIISIGKPIIIVNVVLAHGNILVRIHDLCCWFSDIYSIRCIIWINCNIIFFSINACFISIAATFSLHNAICDTVAPSMLFFTVWDWETIFGHWFPLLVLFTWTSCASKLFALLLYY